MISGGTGRAPAGRSRWCDHGWSGSDRGQGRAISTMPSAPTWPGNVAAYRSQSCRSRGALTSSSSWPLAQRYALLPLPTFLGTERDQYVHCGGGRPGRVPNAELAGTVQLWEWIGDEGATTFSY